MIIKILIEFMKQVFFIFDSFLIYLVSLLLYLLVFLLFYLGGVWIVDRLISLIEDLI